MKWTRRREQRKTKKKQHLSSFSGALPLSLISKLKRLTTKPSSRPHRPKRSDPPKPVSCSSSPTAGTTPSPYGHRYSAHRPPSSPVDDVLHRIASRFPPSEGDERLIVRSRTSHPTQLISLTDLELRPIRCRRSGFPLVGSSLETPLVLEIPFEIERSGINQRLRQWNRRRRRLTNGLQTPPRRQPRHHLCSLSLISHPSPSTPWTSLPSASSPSLMRMSPPPLFSLILSFVGLPSPPLLSGSFLRRLAIAAIPKIQALPMQISSLFLSSTVQPLLLALLQRCLFSLPHVSVTVFSDPIGSVAECHRPCFLSLSLSLSIVIASDAFSFLSSSYRLLTTFSFSVDLCASSSSAFRHCCLPVFRPHPVHW